MDTKLRKDTKDYLNYEILNATNLQIIVDLQIGYQYYEL
jgi:hypothetical protein